MHNWISGTDKIYFKLKLEESQKLIVRSFELEAIKFWSGMNSADNTDPLCALTFQINSDVLALYTLKRGESLSKHNSIFNRSKK